MNILRCYITTIPHYSCTEKNKEFILERMMREADKSGEPVLLCATEILVDIEHGVNVSDMDYIDELSALYTRDVMKEAVDIINEVIIERNKRLLLSK